MKTISTLILMTGLLSCAGDAKESVIPYPENYREWKHIKSMLIQKGHPLADPFAGMHHIYANEAAADGYKNGKFKDGSVIVFDLLDVKDENHAVHESERKLIGVMVKSSENYGKTGGWAFEGFSGDSRSRRLVTDGGRSCFSCHASQEEQDFVFSKYR